MKRKLRWTLEMLTASLAVLCGLLLLVLLVQRPTAWLLLAVLVVLWGIGATLFRCKLRRWVVRWTSGTTFEKSKVQFSLEPLSQPAALLSGDRMTFDALRCEAPELRQLPVATYVWFEKNYLDRDYPLRFVLRCNGVEFPETLKKEP